MERVSNIYSTFKYPNSDNDNNIYVYIKILTIIILVSPMKIIIIKIKICINNNNMIHAHPVVSLFCDPNVTLLDRQSQSLLH
jgi:hypothetical protein